MNEDTVKAHVLTSKYSGSSSEIQILRIYLDKDIEQARKDVKMLEAVSSDQIALVVVEIYNSK